MQQTLYSSTVTWNYNQFQFPILSITVRLPLYVWRNKHISLKVKVRLYESLVMSTMLCSAELWPLTIPQKKRLDAAHHKFQRRLLGITWKSKMRNQKSDETTEHRTSSSRKEDWDGLDMYCEWKRTGYQSKPHDDKWTHAPEEEPKGWDWTGLTP